MQSLYRNLSLILERAFLAKKMANMARKLDDALAKLPAKRRAGIEQRAAEPETLKDLRQVVEQTQEELASALGVGQVSGIEE